MGGKIVFQTHIGAIKTISRDFSPSVGDFIIFPSWAAHSVDPNQDKDDRIVTAGNVFAETIKQEFFKGFK